MAPLLLSSCASFHKLHFLRNLYSGYYHFFILSIYSNLLIFQKLAQAIQSFKPKLNVRWKNHSESTRYYWERYWEKVKEWNEYEEMRMMMTIVMMKKERTTKMRKWPWKLLAGFSLLAPLSNIAVVGTKITRRFQKPSICAMSVFTL